MASAPDRTLPPHGAWIGQLWGASADEARAGARQIEAAGFGAVWISEAHGREVFSLAAILLAATESVVVCTGIANMWARDAVAMTNAARTLAEAWPARFVLGVGISHQPLVDRRGHRYGTPLEHAREYLAAMGRATYRSVPPDPEPLVLVGALGDKMLGLAAEHTQGVHPYLVTPSHTAHARELVGPDQLLAPEQAFALSEDPSAARAAGRAHLTTYLALDNYVRSLGRQGFSDADLEDGGSDHLIDSLVAWGNPSQVADRVAEHVAAGADHVALQPLPGDGVADPFAQLVALAPALDALPTR